MEKISYKLYKITYPYICGDCGYLHYDNRAVCEGCGEEGTVRECKKIDYRIWRDERK